MKNLFLIVSTVFSSAMMAEGLIDIDFEEPNHLVPDKSVYAQPFLMDYSLMVSEMLPPMDLEKLRIFSISFI